MMDREAIFRAWAPAQSAWSAWAKPVLFAQLPGSFVPSGGVPPPVDVPWLPPSGEGCAIVVDMPGETGVLIGLAAAQQGYRPVPLYNACAGPAGPVGPAPILGGPAAVGVVSAVDMHPVMNALAFGAVALAAMRLAEDAPPVFLLDSRRRGSALALTPGTFDNRSISLPTDFPSANRLIWSGIAAALLVQADQINPKPDLAHTLLRWQEAGLPISAIAIEAPGALARPIRIARPRWYRSMLYAVLGALGFRRNLLGGFGGMIPVPSAG